MILYCKKTNFGIYNGGIKDPIIYKYDKGTKKIIMYNFYKQKIKSTVWKSFRDIEASLKAQGKNVEYYRLKSEEEIILKEL